MDRKKRDVIYHNQKKEEDDSGEAEVVLSNKGGPKIIHNNFMYTLHKKHPFNIRWRCVARSYYCRGSLITTADCKKPRVHMEHNHEPDYIAVKAARRRYKDLGKPAIADLQPYGAERQEENQEEPVEFNNFQEEPIEIQEEKVDINSLPGKYFPVSNILMN